MRSIPIAGPSITDHEVALVANAARTAWYESANDVTERFEHEFAGYVGRAHAISLPSCTSALHLSLAALDIGEGDEVIVPDSTWIASAAPVSYVGASLKFADVDPVTWCIDPHSVESLISSRTRAVIAVDLYGGMPAYDVLHAICDPLGVAVIEDAAESIGSIYKTSLAGSFGLVSAFSFHGSKTMTTGEGGMLVTDDDEISDRVSRLRDHGRLPADTNFFNAEVGFKYKMSSLQAALGQAQLDRIDELVAAKRRIFGWYSERLGQTEGLQLNSEPSGTLNSYWMTTVVIESELPTERDQVRARLSGQGIATRPFFHPLSSLPAYQEAPDSERAQQANRISAFLGSHGLNLPSALSLTEDDVDYVCACLTALLAPSRAGSNDDDVNS